MYISTREISVSAFIPGKCKFNVKHRECRLAQSPEPEAHDKVLDNSRSNWNLEMLVTCWLGYSEITPFLIDKPVVVPCIQGLDPM